jgi:hypothetical protein
VGTPLIEPLDGARASWWPGDRVPILEGHGLEASKRRRKAVRAIQGGAWPGKSLVVSEPTYGLRRAVCPCADSPAQARSLLGLVRETGPPGALGSQDRHCCPCAFLGASACRGAWFLTRPPAGLPCEPVHGRRSVGHIATGPVAEQRVQGRAAQGCTPLVRRIRGKLDQATRDGDNGLDLLTHLPRRQVSAKRVARFDRKRWTLETACQPLAASCQSDIHTWGYPKAALVGCGRAVVASHRWAVGMAAWRRVPGAETMDQDRSLYAVANDIAHTYHGRMMAIPEDAWHVFSRMRPAEMVATLRAVAQKVCLKGDRKSPRGPKKPRPKREGTTKAPQVSTAKLLRHLKVNAATP